MRTILLTPFIASFVCLAPVMAAQEPAGVTNFHQINSHVCRGAQPSNEGFQSLARIGVKTVIDLRESGSRAAAERKVVEAAGMRYINIPLNGHAAPTEQQVTKLLELLNDQSAGPVFVHCRRGADRTGTILACYRISHDHWDNEKALHEAKSNGMSWTEMAMKHYVLGYKFNDRAVASADTAVSAQE